MKIPFFWQVGIFFQSSEIEMNLRFKIKNHINVELAMIELANLWMIKLYFDFLGKSKKRQAFDLI